MKRRPPSGPAALLERLETLHRARPGASEAEAALEAAASFAPRDASGLARLHDGLLFLRAYPHSPGVLALAEERLGRIADDVARLGAAGVDLSPLDEPSVAGIAGLPIAMPFSWAASSWLARRDLECLRVDWDAEDLPDRLAAFLPRFVPGLEEQARVDANVPFRAYVDAARGAEPDAAWLVRQVDALPHPDAVKAELWEATGLQLAWTPRPADSRGLARFPGPGPFCSDAPLLSRRDVSVPSELFAPPPSPGRLSRRDGAAVLDAARAAMAVRYRELPAFSAGDPSSVFRFDVGRGVSISSRASPANRASRSGPPSEPSSSETASSSATATSTRLSGAPTSASTSSTPSATASLPGSTPASSPWRASSPRPRSSPSTPTRSASGTRRRSPRARSGSTGSSVSVLQTRLSRSSPAARSAASPPPQGGLPPRRSAASPPRPCCTTSPAKPAPSPTPSTSETSASPPPGASPFPASPQTSTASAPRPASRACSVSRRRPPEGVNPFAHSPRSSSSSTISPRGRPTGRRALVALIRAKSGRDELRYARGLSSFTRLSKSLVRAASR